jgi:RimJ/RimL family protein N-acetyltransferase
MPGIPVAVRQAMWALDGSRVALRRPHPADEHAYAATMDDDFRRINGWDTGLVDRSLQLIRSPPAISLLAWALIWSRETGSVVGSISADQVDADGRTCELGWWLGPGHRGRGYGTEAVCLALGALHAAGVERIRIGTALDNVAVRRVAAKVGAAEESQTGHRLPNGRRVDAIWYVHTSPAAPHGVGLRQRPRG